MPTTTATVTEVFQGAPLAPGVKVTSVAVAVTDSAGTVQSGSLTGAETPTPWTIAFTIAAAGKGSVSSTATMSDGTVGTPVVQAFDTGTGTVALSLSGTTVVITTA